MRCRGVCVTALLTCALLPACGNTDTAATSSPTSGARRRTSAALATQHDFDQRNFTSGSIDIDNEWLPLTPGTQFIYEGHWNRGQGDVEHQVIFTVTDLTKVIDGVDTVVLLDRDQTMGNLAEVEITFFAQDDQGNVWNMGEYPEEYENGTFAGAPSTWLSGVQRARAGIMIRGRPQPNTPSYLQGFAPLVEFRDRAEVAKAGQRACASGTCYDDALLIDEWSPLAPADGHQLKYYARNVGNVRVEPATGVEDETLELVSMKTMDAATRSAANAQASRLDRLAYRVAAPVYGRTEPAKQRRPKRGA